MSHLILQFRDSKAYDIEAFKKINELKYNNNFEFNFISETVNTDNIQDAQGSDAICCFVNDNLNREIIEKLSKMNCKLITLRCAGFDLVDLESAQEFNIPVVNVPSYSPISVAEHGLSLMLCANRNIVQANKRIAKQNFNIEDLQGYSIQGKTVGVIGTERIGQNFINLLKGFDCNILAYDLYPNHEAAKTLNFKYTSLEEIYKLSDFIVLWCTVIKETKYIVNESSLKKMKKTAIIINCSRGSLIKTDDLLKVLDNNQIRAVAIDVYEKEKGIFFNDFSNQTLQDPILLKLINNQKVIMTSHQAFLTYESLEAISSTTLNNIDQYLNNKVVLNQVK